MNFDLRGRMAATLTNKVSSLLQANSDEVYYCPVGDWAIGDRLLAIEVVGIEEVKKGAISRESRWSRWSR